MMPFIEGEKVLTVGGIYKQHRCGMYVRPYGTKMATMKLDGDAKQEKKISN
jgi:hypothetical protein